MGRDSGGHALISYHQLVIDWLKLWWMLLPTPLEAETLIDLLMRRLQEKAADTIESLHKAGMKVWVLTGDKMETAAATCYASKLFRRSTQILELTKKRTEEQSLHDVLFELNRTVIRQRSISGYVCICEGQTDYWPGWLSEQSHLLESSETLFGLCIKSTSKRKFCIYLHVWLYCILGVNLLSDLLFSIFQYLIADKINTF